VALVMIGRGQACRTSLDNQQKELKLTDGILVVAEYRRSWTGVEREQLLGVTGEDTGH